MTITKEIIVEKLASNPKWLLAGIVAIYNRQTADEQSADATQEDNKMGFNGVDARFGSSLAKRILSGYSLSPKQMAAGAKMMKKYAGQLLLVAKEKQGL
jgi:hypothetical protein